MPATLRLIHTSDCHLGWETNPSHAERGFAAVVKAVRATAADGLLIAGDLFDSNRVGDTLVERVLSHLGSLSVPVIVLPGNHDAYDDSSVYRRPLWQRAPENIHLLLAEGGQEWVSREANLVVWGKPVVAHTPDFRPLEGVPPRNGLAWHIVLAHGLCVPDDAPSVYSSPIRPADLEAIEWDYVALGHHDVFQEVTVGRATVIYSGSPSRLVSAGGLNCVALVSLDPVAGVRVEAYPLTPSAAQS